MCKISTLETCFKLQISCSNFVRNVLVIFLSILSSKHFCYSWNSYVESKMFCGAVIQVLDSDCGDPHSSPLWKFPR